ncbi:MAG: abortive infection family protein [Syntrophobacteraceae bacterium]
MEFDAADVPCDLNYQPTTSGQRRSLVEQYYHAVDWSKWSDVRKVLTVYENLLSQLEELDSAFQRNGYAQTTFKSLKKWIEKDGFHYSGGKLTPVLKHQGLQEISEAATTFDAPELHRQIQRLQNAVEEDPALAIGTAKELVETTCKTILDAREIQYFEGDDLTKLVKETRRALGLIQENVPDAAKGAESIRRLLSNLGGIAQGMCELRNLYGTGHGKAGHTKGLSPRHARLAVGTAVTLATFLFETHQERNI